MTAASRFRSLVCFSFLASLLLVSIPVATAASSFGACSKSGAKLRISGSLHTCGKNPVVKSRALVWLPNVCVRTNRDYLAKQSQIVDLEKGSVAAIAKIDQAIVAWRAQSDAFERAAKEKDAIAEEARTKAANAKVRAANALASAKAAGENTTAGRQLLSSASNWEGNAKAYERAQRIAIEEAAKIRATVAKEIADLESSKSSVGNDIEAARADLKLLNANRRIVCTKI